MVYTTRRQKSGPSNLRPLSTTFAQTLNPMASGKCNGGEPFKVEAESEQLTAQILDLDDEVLSYAPQAIGVDLIHGTLLLTAADRNRARSEHKGKPPPCVYTGDFSVLNLRSPKQAVETKLDAFTGDEVYHEKIARAAGVLERHGWEFVRLVLPADQTRPIWSNVALVCQASARKDLWPSSTIVDQIATLAHAGAATARDYLLPLGLDNRSLPILIACGALRADLEAAHLSAATTVAAAYGDRSHLALLGRFTT